MTRKRIVIAVLVIAAFFAGFRYRIYAENWYWHFRHGEALAIDEYRVPVPKNWFVQEIGENGRLLLRLDTDDHSGNPGRDRKGRSRAFVSVWVNNTLLPSEKLERLTSIEVSAMRQRGHEPAFRNFEFDNEKLICLGGETFNQGLSSARPSAPLPQFYEKDPNIWNCKSSGRLDLQLSGTDPDMPQIWEIVSGIRKGS